MSGDGIRAGLVLASIAMLVWVMHRAAGRLGPRAALAPIAFLATRPVVIAAWIVGAIGMFAMLASSAHANGKLEGWTVSTWMMAVGVCAFSGGGVACLLVGPPFFVMRLFAAKPALSLEPGELVLDERRGNHFLHRESRGGKIILTNRRLAFVPNRFNVQLDVWSMRLDDVRSVVREGERFIVIDTGTSSEWIVTMKAERLRGDLALLASMPEAERKRALSERPTVSLPHHAPAI